jgi:hypothetical protein
MRKAVAYYRVSTERQRRSGLGVDAQRTAVQRFVEVEGLLILGEYVEAESAKGADALATRPRLAAALAAARSAKCPVILAKLDRLSRDVAFVSGLMTNGCHSSLRNSASTRPRSCSTYIRRWPRRALADLSAPTRRARVQEGGRGTARQSNQHHSRRSCGAQHPGRRRGPVCTGDGDSGRRDRWLRLNCRGLEPRGHSH